MNKKQIESKGEIILYQSKNGSFSVDVKIEKDTVWLNQKQLAEVFNVEVHTINYHMKSIFRQKELKKSATIRKFRIVQKEGKREVERLVEFYNLDMIISVGYRVNSKQATQFRIWATNILKEYLIKGIAIDEKKLQQRRIKELEGAHQLIQKAIHSKKLSYDEQAGLLKVITDYTSSWILLEQYDKKKLKLIKGKKRVSFKIEYNEIKKEIEVLKKKLIQKNEATKLFGDERSSAFEGILGNLYQTFDKHELYPTIEEKAAHLLYFVIKDHPFTDGNKRIGSFLFILYLSRNNCLFDKNGQNKINDNGLVALALMVAQSNPKDKENMIKLITNLIA